MPNLRGVNPIGRGDGVGRLYVARADDRCGSS